MSSAKEKKRMKQARKRYEIRYGTPKPDGLPSALTWTGGFAKLEEAGYRFGAYFTAYGFSRDPENPPPKEEDGPYYLTVTLNAVQGPGEQWRLWLNVSNGDDSSCSIWRPVTPEGWKELYDIYSKELVIPEAFDYANLIALGFENF